MDYRVSEALILRLTGFGALLGLILALGLVSVLWGVWA